ncbi:hypothetical protein Q8G38_15980 [Halomonas venusta]|uniref:hypothetical protein n=1 Tax=Vreelandella venusta TaxID=44935 RepID=UPI00295E76C8|nr:hypothetical protein [Halomonas venusta]MDW0360812.1 hypothetical protein [Halomonas venusta]
MGYKAGRVDRKKVNNGVAVELMGATWIVARAGNAQALDVVEEVRKANLKTGEERIRANAEIVADGILRGWEDDVEDINGAPLPYSREAAIEILIDDPELAEGLLAEARRNENFYRDDVEAQKKKR